MLHRLLVYGKLMKLSESGRRCDPYALNRYVWKLCWCLALQSLRTEQHVVQVSLRDWCNSIQQAATVDKRLQRIRFAFVLPRTDSAHADTYRVVMVPDISHAVWTLNAETGESMSALVPFPWGDFHIVSCLL